MVGISDFEPMMMPTSGVSAMQCLLDIRAALLPS
jgi:hypothetical protein